MCNCSRSEWPSSAIPVRVRILFAFYHPLHETFLAAAHVLASSLPVPAGYQWAGSLAPLYEDIGSTDFAIVPGRAVFGHPGGPKAGAMSLLQGWEAIKAGVSLEAYAREHHELELSIRHNTE